MAVPYAPVTHVDGQSWTAAKANALETAVGDAQRMYAVRAFHNASQSINNSTNTVLALNSERFDQFAGAASTMHDTVTNNSRLTALAAGVYSICGNVQWASNATGERLTEVLLNGTTVIARTRFPAGAATVLNQTVTCHYALATNDYVELRVFQTSGGALNVEVQANLSPEFSMVRVA